MSKVSHIQPLFEPWQHPKLSLKNRIVMAPMTRWKSPNGIPTEEVAAYYERRAKDGVGLEVWQRWIRNPPLY